MENILWEFIFIGMIFVLYMAALYCYHIGCIHIIQHDWITYAISAYHH